MNNKYLTCSRSSLKLLFIGEKYNYSERTDELACLTF